MTNLRILVAVCGVAMACGLPGRAGAAGKPTRAASAPRSVTVPFSLDHNRMIVDVEFTRPDGTLRRARAWVDTGDEVLVLAEPLARELGLDLSAIDAGAVGHSVAIGSAAPPTRIGGLPLDVAGVGVQVRLGTHVPAGASVEVQLPASALRHDHVVFDYPARRLTVARRGVLKSRGEAIPCRVNPVTGLLMIAATLDGESVWLGVDNGSAGTWLSDSLTRTWQARHPNWPHAIGAAGSANFFGFPFEARGVLMRLPAIELGALRARDVAVLGLPQSLFAWYSKKSAGPVLGFIGANVLRGFRLEIDFPGQMTYWLPAPPTRSRDLDIVGLTLRPEPDGSTTVVGVVTKDGQPVVEGVQPGDKLLGVDGRNLATARMGEVVDALRGEPGTVRMLVLERAGKRLTVRAPVTRLP
jgi:hypothetical protein